MLSKEQIEQKKKFIHNYIQANNAATGSVVDSNANVSSKNIATLVGELYKPETIQLKRNIVTQNITDMFGKDLADEYNRQVESHELYVNDESGLNPYCCSVSLYPFLLNGTKDLGGESVAPKYMESFSGSFINLVFALSSQFSGAIATVEWLFLLDFYARKKFGDNYLKFKKAKKEIETTFKQVIYSLNQPASARSYQSVFWNISIFDESYFNELFSSYVFPESLSPFKGENPKNVLVRMKDSFLKLINKYEAPAKEELKPNYKSLDQLQRCFMTWFNKERERAVLTFPVVTASLLTEKDKPKDEGFVDFLAKEMSEGNSFFVYMSDNASALSSCCFPKDQLVLVKDSKNGVRLLSLESLYNEPHRSRPNLQVMNNGAWSNTRSIRVPRGNKKLYEITTAKNQKIICTEDHVLVTDKGDTQAGKVNTSTYLLVNTMVLPKISERDEKLTYEQGVLVGAYLGDGNIDGRRITYSFNENKTKNLSGIIGEALQQLGESQILKQTVSCNNVVFNTVNSDIVCEFLNKWCTTLHAHEKDLNLDALMQSEQFRRGVLDGFHKTDGHNTYNVLYTSSSALAKSLECLVVSLGGICNISLDDRTDEDVVIRGKVYKRNYPVYHVRFMFNRHKEVRDVLKVRNNQLFIKVVDIKPYEYDDEFVYCVEMADKEDHYFTLPNGVHVSNCRLRNEMTDNQFSYSLGAGGIATGSMNVITLNVNRFVQDHKDNYLEALGEQVDKIHKYQMATKKWFDYLYECDMLPAYSAGYITMKKQFLTIGINGFAEAAEFLGIDPTNNDEYKKFTESFLRVIYDKNKEGYKKYGQRFNTEFVPAENLGVKNYKWDKKGGYVVPEDRVCYNSYFYRVEDNNITIPDKFVLHGKDNLKYLDGGSALHLNLEEYPTKEGYKRLFELAAKTGCNYWTTNVAVTCCEDCGYINKNTVDHCTKCGSRNITYATRIIGYLKKISAFSDVRQKEAGIRHYHKNKLK